MRNVFLRSSVPWLLSQLEWLLVENLWVRMKGKAKKAAVTVGVYYLLPSQDNTTDELLSTSN